MDMMHAMRFVHHWAPTTDHLFDSSCAPTAVHFAPRLIRYNTSCTRGIETLKITYSPTVVTAGGQPLKQRRPPMLRVSAAGRVQQQAAETTEGAADGEEEDWYEYDVLTGLLRVAHATHADIVISARGS